MARLQPTPTFRARGAARATTARFVVSVLGGGVVAVACASSHPVAAPIVAPAPTSSPDAPRADASPPPSAPPPLRPDAGAGPRSSRPIACPAECRGLAPASFRDAVAQQARSARRCYEQALSRDPDLQGRVVVAIRVTESGDTCSATIASSDIGDSGMMACVLATMRVAYPAPEGGCVNVQVPLRFTPKRPADGGAPDSGGP